MPAFFCRALLQINTNLREVDPKYVFPAQEQVISATSELIKACVIDGDMGALRRGGIGGKDREKQEQMIKGWLGISMGAKKEEEEISSSS